MADPDLALSAYLQLAAISHARGQWLPRNKFLILAGAAACAAGLLGVAERCRELVRAHSPNHMVSKYESFPAALKSAEFQTYHTQLRKFCSIERAEHLLLGQGYQLEPATETSANQCLREMDVSAL
ncbi:MAG: hypothetical protein JWN70_492 [Planctomycetaceae bacterium]|nr:hypothetical protein [Planctomycetaceae bacterium]